MVSTDSRYDGLIEWATSEPADAPTRAYLDQAVSEIRAAYLEEGVDLNDAAQRRIVVLVLGGTLDALRIGLGVAWAMRNPEAWNMIAGPLRIVAELELSERQR